MSTEKLNFAGHEVILDASFLKFSESTLNEYIQRESAYYDNFGAYLSLAEKNLQNKELQCDKLFADRFVEAKESGSSDKLAEQKAKSDSDVVFSKQEVIDARYIVNRLKQHLRAWDKNHDNAQSLGHMLRKTMDKLYGEILLKYKGTETTINDALIEETVRSFEKEPESGEFETELSAENLF